jgi:hypothetical protein
MYKQTIFMDSDHQWMMLRTSGVQSIVNLIFCSQVADKESSKKREQ